MKFRVEAVSENVHIVRFDDVVRAGWRQYALLSGDRHHDNVHSDWKLERQHLELAQEREAPIVDLGDLHDAMQGKKDSRQDKDQLRPEYLGNDYSDRLVNVAESFYGPYARLFAVMAYGNHETSALRHLETDLTARTARRLRFAGERTDWPFAGGYGGWVFFRFRIQKTITQTIKLKYHHGHGGGGPVTKGTIQANRRATFLPDADIVATAHIHEAWSLPYKRERVSQQGKVYQDYQWHVSVPTYKDEYDNGAKGYHIEKGRPPKPKGCAWLIFEYQDGRVVPKVELDLS